MSRSYKKEPVYSITGAPSNKRDKVQSHQAQRSHFKTELNSGTDIDEVLFDERNIAHSNSAVFSKEAIKRARLATRRQGDRLIVDSAPAFIKSDRDAHALLGK